jgi:hypothetical protein
MNVVKADDVTKEKLIEILTNAALEVVEEDDEPNEVYVKGLDFGVWLSFDDEKKIIRMKTYAKCKDDAPLDELAALSESCNAKYMLVQFSSTVYDDGIGYLNGNCYMYYNFGLIPPQLIFTLKKFATIYIEAVREKDSEDKFFS